MGWLRLACSSLAFSKQPFAEALRLISALGFNYVDLGVLEGWAHIFPSQLTDDVERIADTTNEALSNYGLVPIAFNANLGTRETDVRGERMRGLLTLAERLEVNVVTLPAEGGNVREAAGLISPLVELAQDRGISIAVETHIGHVTEDPERALRLVEEVPGLGLTLDPSHYYAGKNQGRAFNAIYPYVRHLHVRDAGLGGWEAVQVAVGTGAVDFPGILRGLTAHGYTGNASVEYIDTIGDLDVRRQLIEAKALVEKEWEVDAE